MKTAALGILLGVPATLVALPSSHAPNDSRTAWVTCRFHPFRDRVSYLPVHNPGE